MQTLSRLNRICPGRRASIVSDFANDAETVKAAFEEALFNEYYNDRHGRE